ncbi:HER138Wp [Eremothecium sinecaudum]|uniref:HER138Wp n=1 Tax=Eremothecium sinecaudum TaxID=45286 RepID=A0A0X8HTZ3_9SACH|nr:HER138Wp [Eremothecium sinecaudum]AMD21417.1 HER138Wp [Eremothecium sinecaudum]
MNNYFSRTKTGSIDPVTLSREFNDIDNRITSKISAGNDIQQVKDTIIGVSRELSDISGLLSSYDRERYSNRIDELLKATNANRIGNSTTSVAGRRFKFKSKPASVQKLPALQNELFKNKITIDEEVPCSPTKLTENEDIVLDLKQSHYSHLKNCRVTVRESVAFPSSFALSISHADTSDISLKPIPFNQGSIFIEHCENCTIFIICPSKSNIQIRLHHLKSCKLCIYKEGQGTSQTVVIEECASCIFDESCNEKVTIQNFSNLGFTSTGKQSYAFSKWLAE